MIDRSLINPTKLLDIMLDDVFGNVNAWWSLVEIIPDYMPPFPSADTRPSIQVRCLVRPNDPEPGPGIRTDRYSYLRGSRCGWRNGGYFWDIGGDSDGWTSVEDALLAVLHAPVPPALLSKDAWMAIRASIRRDAP